MGRENNQGRDRGGLGERKKVNDGVRESKRAIGGERERERERQEWGRETGMGERGELAMCSSTSMTE